MESRRMTREAFSTLVSEAFVRLPERFRKLVENVALLVDDVVPEDTCRELGLSSNKDLLGLYTGVPKTERHNDAGFALPDTITLFQIPIEEHAEGEGKSVAEVVYETLWHEIGHHFGLDEEAVEKREREEFG